MGRTGKTMGQSLRVSREKPKQCKEKPTGIAKVFGDVANRTSQAAGRASTFIVAACVVIVWAVTGPLFGYSDTWQLVINTGTTIVTFSDGVLDSKFPEPRQRRDPGQAG